jgi:DNA-directed RNA polymerase subunit M/transcription elongation factor TFIIS
MRICKECGRALPIKDFASAGVVNGKQYYRHKCKKCYNIQKRNYKRIQARKLLNTRNNSNVKNVDSMIIGL